MNADNKLIGQLTAKAKSLEAELQQARMVLRSRKSNTPQKSWLALGDSTMQPREEEETWFATYLDMMTLLLVLMIVMLAFAGKGEFEYGTDKDANAIVVGARADGQFAGVTINAKGTAAQQGGAPTENALTEENQSAHRLEDLGLEGLSDDIDVVLNDETVSFRINSEILFPSGQADLSLAGVTVLQSLINVLKKNDFQIAVEGHTDSIPIRSSRFPSNWELSSSRAGSVVRYFEANGIASDRLRAVGYADTRALDTNATAEGRAQNRRVELTMEIPKAK